MDKCSLHRLTLRLSCHMSFRLYPLDTQRCWIVLGSCEYNLTNAGAPFGRIIRLIIYSLKNHLSKQSFIPCNFICILEKSNFVLLVIYKIITFCSGNKAFVTLSWCFNVLKVRKILLNKKSNLCFYPMNIL